MPFTISSTIPEIAAKLYRGIPPQLLDAGVAMIAEELKDRYTEAVIREEPERTGQLKDKTASTVTPMPGMAMLETRSDAQNQSNQHYAYFVYTQHRIVAWGHDTGRLSVPNEFPKRAMAAMLPRIEAESLVGAEETATRILRILA